MRRPGISAVILAGGRARRMGGVDKGLLELKGKALVQHVIERIQPQVDNILISANRNQADYATFGFPVVSDSRQEYLGPLAGIAAALSHCATEFLLVVPCDTPFLPDDLATTLMTTLRKAHAEVCLAHDGERLQALVALLSRSLEERLDQSIELGRLKVARWMLAQNHCIAQIPDPVRFININTSEDLARADTLL